MGKVCKKCGSDNTYFTGKAYNFNQLNFLLIETNLIN